MKQVPDDRTGRTGRFSRGELPFIKGGGKGTGSGTRTQHVKVTRHSRKGWRGRFVERAAGIWADLLERPWVWVTLLVLAGTWTLLPPGLLFVPTIAPGSIATRDYVAPRDLLVLDEESTAEKERRSREEVLPIYDFDSSAVGERQEALGRLFQEGRRLEAPSGEGPPGPDVGEGLVGRLEERSGLKLTGEQIVVLLEERFSFELEDRIKSLARQVLSQGVVGNKGLLLENRMRGITRRDLSSDREVRELDLYGYLGYPEEVRELLESEVRDWSGFSAADRRALVDLLTVNLHPNLSLNQSETLARRDLAAQRVERTFNQVRKGQVVARKGDEISPLQARLINQLYGRPSWQRLVLPLAGTLLLLLLASTVLWLALRRERVADHSPNRLFDEALILLLGSILAAKFSVLTAVALSAAFNHPVLSAIAPYLWAVPWASLALVSALLGGRQIALFLSLLSSILLVRLVPGMPLEILLYSIAGSLAAIFAVERFQLKQRLALAKIGLLVALVNVVTILLLSALFGDLDRGAGQMGFSLFGGVVGGLLTAAVVSFVLPILESLFGITTEMKLIELSNTNLPLLRRLAMEAPGTFQHSLMVANLCKEGCEAIGADAVVAYTGALYHDIGKVFRPEYFIENQRPGMNPHDKLQPSMSALVLINHVKEGVELARRHHLPRPILDAIEQHHGTRLITFFYKRAQEQCDPDTHEVREEKYRYSGPRPQNKVMGVLMLADGVEAASRTLTDPSPVKIRTLLRTIFEDCLKDGQLDQTDLTLSDVKKVGEAFFRVLTNLFHQRVDYPGFDFNVPARPRKIAARAS